MIAPQASQEGFCDVAVEEIMAFHDRVDAGTADGRDLHRDRLAGVAQRYDASPDLTAVVDRYREVLVAHSVPLPGAGELLRELKRRGIKLGMVTNAYDVQEQRLRVRHAFPGIAWDALVVAAECSQPKPDRAPFDEVLRRLDCAAANGIYVGDIPRYDVPGALAVGMRAVIVAEHPGVVAEAHALGAESVSRLDELLAVLCGE